MKNFRFTYLFATLLLVGCGNDSEEVEYKSFEGFKNEVVASIDGTYVNCGVVRLGESNLDANTCAAESFQNQTSFIAIYELQGIDSNVGSALVVDGGPEVEKWHYDSNPCGGVPACDSKIYYESCSNPSLSGVLDGDPSDIFVCE